MGIDTTAGSSTMTLAWQHANIWAGGKLLGTYDKDGLHFYLDDPLGTRRAQTDWAGNLEQTCSSLPYGDNLNCSGGDLLAPTEHHFTGKERDIESGNDYFEARYYSSAMGRFMSPDWSAQEEPVPYSQLDDPQSLNLYVYVENNPLDRIDADGHGWWGDFGNGLADATYRPIAQMAAHPGATVAALGNAAQHPIKTAVAATQAVVATGKAALNGDGHAIGVVVGTIVMTAVPGAGEAGDTAEVTSDVTKLSELGEAGEAAEAVGKVKTYQTYTKTNPTTGEVYFGRTSGFGTPEENIAARDLGHHMNEEGFGPAKLDKSSTSADAIRGREQELIDFHGGAKKSGGTSGNKINGVAKGNKKASIYKQAAKEKFGSK